MAYVIGSTKGQNIAKNMKTGETYKCSDGSTWTKKSDGSVSVKTSNGQTFNNAYKPTTSSSSSSSSSKSTSSSSNSSSSNKATNYSNGGSSNKNSQYTSQYTGSQYQSIKNYANQLDGGYQQVINDAVARGDYLTAAMAEQLRNEKIANTDSIYGPTNLYQQYLPNQAENWLEEYVQENEQPVYEDKYDTQIDELINQILNRDDFSYNAENDPLYQQYANMYQREGDRAMKETLAEVAAGAGGMNSWAVTAAQQAANNYSAKLNDTIPQLYQLAYDMYLADKESQIQDLGILQNASATQYNRYRDTMNDYYNDKNFAYSLYQNDVANGQWQQQFDYNKNQDALAQNNWQTQWDYGIKQDELNNSRYDQETAKEEVWKYIEMGVVPSADLIVKAGMNQADVENYVAAVQAQLAPRNTSRTSTTNNGGYVGGNDENNNGFVGKDDEEKKNGGSDLETKNEWVKGMTDLGLGLVYSPDILVELANAGAIYEDSNGLHWANGWNAQNFQSKLGGASKLFTGLGI